MKRYITRVIVLVLAGMLLSCGGGGDSNSGGSPANDSGGTPGNDTGGTPGNDTGGTPGNGSGGDPGNDDGGGTGTFPSAGAHVEESDAAVTLSAGWTKTSSGFGWSGGAAVQSTVAGATASFTFTGTSVRWIGSRSRRGGIAKVSVDGGPATEVDLFARPLEIRTPVITLNGLSDGNHTLTIEVTGRQNPEAAGNVVAVDAFDVQPQIVSHLQESDPDLTFSDGWAKAEETSSWSGCCVRTLPEPAIGGAMVTETAGKNVTLKFRGTSITWIGYRGPDAGIARVRVDGGEPSEVDLYSPTLKVQEVVFTATGLTDAPHTLTIEATGRRNDASTGARVVVDAFDVTTPGRRYQEHEKTWITYSGVWQYNNARVWSEGISATSNVAGSTVTFSFTGTSVSWIGCQKASAGGRAKIYIDGVLREEVHNYRPIPIESYQHTIFRADGLTNGPHTLTIEVTSTNGSYIVVDAFDVHP
jgi:hypothetical protein